MKRLTAICLSLSLTIPTISFAQSINSGHHRKPSLFGGGSGSTMKPRNSPAVTVHGGRAMRGGGWLGGGGHVSIKKPEIMPR